MQTKPIFLTLTGLVASVSMSVAQISNQAAMDTLTKDVAKVVFARINQPKAQDIYDQLLDCGDNCDPQTIIRNVGGWDAVGAKMEELSLLKTTAPFAKMTAGDANAAIRKQFAQFIARYKNDNNYGKPLNPVVQAEILQKIDRLLPPNPEPEQTAATPTQTAVSADENPDESGVDPTAFQVGQLERQLKEKQENDLWKMILAVLGGLIVGGGAVYWFLYRQAKEEIDALLAENDRLRQVLNTTQRAKSPAPGNAIRTDDQRKAREYDVLVEELGSKNPLMAIRQLKQQAATGAVTEPVSPEKSAEPAFDTSYPPEPIQLQEPLQPLPPLESLPPLHRSEVFYFPPPDPGGQFDMAQKASSLSPESAYRFSVDGLTPNQATFRFEADPGRVARFLTYRNYMIEPACESENSYTAAHTRVAMRRDGEALFENGTWRVKTKALIRYE